MAESVVGTATYETKVDKSGLESGLHSAGQTIEHTGAQAEQAFGNKASGGMTKFGAVGIGAVAGIGAALTTAGIGLAMDAISGAIDAVGNSMKMAEDQADKVHAANVIFGDSYQAVAAAAEHAATSVGMSQTAYLGAANDLGALLGAMGLTKAQTADMSNSMLQLAADIGTFRSKDPSDVLAAMEKALAGGTKGLKQYGIVIGTADIAQEAMRLGLIGSVAELAKLDPATQKAIKAQATYNLIVKQSADAQGEFAAQSNDMGAQQQIMAARLDDAMTKIGAKLLPLAQKIMPMLADAAVAVIDAISGIVDAITDWVDHNQPLIQQVQAIAGVIGDNLGKAIAFVIPILQRLGQILGGMVGIVMDVLGALVGLGAAVVKVFSGDFAGAAYEADQAMKRLGNVPVDMARIMGDATQLAVDKAAEVVATGTDAANQAFLDMAHVPDAYKEAGAAAINETENTTAGVVGALEDGTDDYGDAADDLAEELPDALSDANKDAKKIAAQTPGEIASGLRSKRDDWQSALDLLKDDMAKSQDATKEMAKLKAKLTGKALTEGLASTDPIVRAQAEETKRLIQERINQLEGIARKAGAAAGNALAAGLAGTTHAVYSSAERLARTVANVLKLDSPAKQGPWSVQGGPIAWMERNGRRMREALVEGLTGDVPIPRLLGIEGMTASPLIAGANLTVRHVVALDLTNAPAGVSNAGVAAMLAPVVDWDSEWQRKMDEAMATSGRRWVGPVL